MEYYIPLKRIAFESVSRRWMNLEPIKRSEVSQKEKDKYYISTYTQNLERQYLRSYMQCSKGSKCKQQTFGLKGGRWTWHDLREQHWNIYITIFKIDGQGKFNEWSRAPKDSAWGQPREIRWGGKRERVQDVGDTYIPVANSCWCMTKIITIL